jgi:hypothetical protein
MRVAHPIAGAVLCTAGIFDPAAGAAQGRTLGAIGQQIGQSVTAGVDAGAAAITYDDYGASRVESISPSVRWETARSMVLANASLSQFESGRTSLQTGVTGSFLSPEFLNVRGEVYGSFSSTRYMQQLAATSVYGVGRLHAATPNAGAWLGAGGGFVSRGSRLPDAITQGDAGVWTRNDAVVYTLAVQPTRVGNTRFADVTAGARWEGARAEVALSSGYRARPTEDVPGVQAWGEGWLTVWLGRRAAVVAGAGVFPFDVVQGLPGGRYASAGLRLVTRRPSVGDPGLRAELTESYELQRLARVARAGGPVDRFVVADNPDGTRLLRLRVSGARRVEVMADFTDWTATPLAAASAPGEWCLVAVIGPGVHRINVRVDDGAWTVPEGLAAVSDEFGGTAGIFVVR